MEGIMELVGGRKELKDAKVAFEKQGITTAELTEMLRQKHLGHEWAFITDVANATGGRHTRRADAIAMSLWPSKGLHLHGFEVKVSRSDWLKEIQDVSKAGEFAQHCHYWWVVAPKHVLKLEELPATWGWLCPTLKGNLRSKRPATLNPLPAQVPYDLLAGLLRGATQQDNFTAKLNAARTDGYTAGRKAGEKWAEDRFLDEKLRLERMDKAVEEFKEKTGLRICHWNDGELAEKVKRLDKLEGAEWRLEQAISTCKQAATLLENAHKAMKEGGAV